MSHAFEMINGLPSIAVTSSGTTKEDFAREWETKGHAMNSAFRRFIRQVQFVPTKGVTYNLAVIPGSELNCAERSTAKSIRMSIDRRGLMVPKLESIFLLRSAIGNEEIRRIGCWWLVGMLRSPELFLMHCMTGCKVVGQSGGGARSGFGSEGGFVFERIGRIVSP